MRRAPRPRSPRTGGVLPRQDQASPLPSGWLPRILHGISTASRSYWPGQGPPPDQGDGPAGDDDFPAGRPSTGQVPRMTGGRTTMRLTLHTFLTLDGVMQA